MLTPLLITVTALLTASVGSKYETTIPDAADSEHYFRNLGMLVHCALVDNASATPTRFPTLLEAQIALDDLVIPQRRAIPPAAHLIAQHPFREDLAR